MKLIGIIMICSGSAMLGFMQGERIRQHYQEMIYLKKMVMLIRGEIRYNCGVLSEVFGNVAEKLKEPYKDIFLKLSVELNKRGGERFNDIWNNTVIKRLGETKLFQSDIEGFKELGENMGYLDIQMQINYIDFYIDRLSMEIRDTGDKLQGSIKLFKTLGIMGGLLLTILIM